MMSIQQTQTANKLNYQLERFMFAPKAKRNDPATQLLAETLTVIADCRLLEEDWDGEDALPVAPETATMARNLVQQISRGIKPPTKWITPSVAPDPNGRLHLLWSIEGMDLLLILDGKQPDHVTCVTTSTEREPVREVLSFQAATQNVLSVLSPQ